MAKYIAKGVRDGSGKALKWAIAGRSRDKLQSLIAELRQAQLPEPDGYLVADVKNVSTGGKACCHHHHILILIGGVIVMDDSLRH